MSKRNNVLRIAALAAALPLALAGCAANEGSTSTPESGAAGSTDTAESSSSISGTYGGAGASSQEAAQAAGASTPLGAAAAQLFGLHNAWGEGGADFSGIIHHLREIAGK